MPKPRLISAQSLGQNLDTHIKSNDDPSRPAGMPRNANIDLFEYIIIVIVVVVVPRRALKGSIGRHTDVLSNILVRYPGILVSVS
jgi:hypothetical protein